MAYNVISDNQKRQKANRISSLIHVMAFHFHWATGPASGPVVTAVSLPPARQYAMPTLPRSAKVEEPKEISEGIVGQTLECG